MAFLTELIMIGLTAAILENVLFTRALGQDFHTHYSKNNSVLLLEGITISVFSVIGSFAGWLGKYFTENILNLSLWVKPAIYITLYGFLVFLLLISLKLLAIKTKRKFTPTSCMLIYGFIPIATILIVAGHDYTIIEAITYGIGAGVGYLLASLINQQIQLRLVYSDVPISFRGIPITLLTFGIISLALFGLMGHHILL